MGVETIFTQKLLEHFTKMARIKDEILNFSYFVSLRLKRYLENIVSWFHICDIDPLTIDVMSIGVPAANGDALFTKVGTNIPFLNTWSKENMDGFFLFVISYMGNMYFSGQI